MTRDFPEGMRMELSSEKVEGTRTRKGGRVLCTEGTASALHPWRLEKGLGVDKRNLGGEGRGKEKTCLLDAYYVPSWLSTYHVLF